MLCGQFVRGWGFRVKSSGIQQVCKQEPYAFDVVNSEYYSLILVLLPVSHYNSHILLWLFYMRQDDTSSCHMRTSAETASLLASVGSLSLIQSHTI